MKRLLFVSLLLCWVVSAIVHDKAEAIDLDNATAAVVGRYIITARDFFIAYNGTCQFYKNSYKGKFTDELEKKLNLNVKTLDSLIDNQIAIMAAEAVGIRVSEKEIQDVITHDPAFMKNGRFDEQVYINTLKLSRLTPEQFKKQKREEMIISKLSSRGKGNPQNAIAEHKKKIKISINHKLIDNARCSK